MSPLTRAVRLSLIALTVGAVAQACGGLDPGTVTVIPDNAAGMANAAGDEGVRGGSTSTGGGAEGGAPSETPQAGAAGDTIGQGGAAMPDGCKADEPCLNGPDRGLCAEGSCTPCLSPDDDAACQASYGDEFLCVKGGCVEGECSSDEDCDGASCVDHHCVPCTSDADCGAADLICNLGTGACVTNDSCGSAAGGQACPVNDLDRCCANANPICEAVECCGSAGCKTTPSAASNDGTCKSGTCVLVGCGNPPAAVRYVDFDGAPGGSGGHGCPYTRLGPALADLTAGGGTIIVKNGGKMAIDSTLLVPPGITITGSDSNFDACTPATCATASKWPEITTGDRRAMNMTTPGNRELRFLRLVGVAASDFKDAQWAALYVSSATLTVDHLEISGYQFGLYADTGGSLEVHGGVRAHHNRTGLYVADGAASVGGSAIVEVVDGGDATSFDSNNFGIVVHGNGLLQLTGPPWGSKKTGLVSANDNGGAGVYFPASNPKAVIDGLEVANNGGDATLANHDGAIVFAHAVVKIRNSYFHDNVANGVHIPGNGRNSEDALLGIDLGQNKKTNPGLNTFLDNGGAGICIEPITAQTVTDGNELPAEGNRFRTLDCTTSGTYTLRGSCTGGVDYADGCHGAADLLGCTAPLVKCVP